MGKIVVLHKPPHEHIADLLEQIKRETENRAYDCMIIAMRRTDGIIETAAANVNAYDRLELAAHLTAKAHLEIVRANMDDLLGG